MSDTAHNITALTKAQENDGDVDLYCVISPHVDAQGIKRSWKPTQASAAKHAKALLGANAVARKGGRKLYVVKVVEVLELPGPKIDSRKPNTDDLEEPLPTRAIERDDDE